MSSTSNARVSFRFWNSAFGDKYTKFVLPTKTAYAGSHTISSSTFSREQIQRSAWTHKLVKPPRENLSSQTTYYPSLLSLGPNCKDQGVENQNGPRKKRKKDQGCNQRCEDTSSTEPKRKGVFQRKEDLKGKLRSYKVKMYPTDEQKKRLRMWYAASNRSYNAAVDIVKGMSTKANLIQVRKMVVPKEVVPNEQKWMLKTPSKVRARAVKQLIDAQHINLKEKGFGKFKLRFRSFRKDPTGTIILEKAFPHDNGPLHHFSVYNGSRNSTGSQKKYAFMHMAPSSFEGCDNAILIRDRHWLVDKLITDGKLTEDGKIIWDKRTDSWHLIVLVDKEVKKKVEGEDGRKVVSLDPGVRHFNTFYSPDGTHGELLVGCTKVAMSMCKKMDKICSEMDWIQNKHKIDLQNQKEGFASDQKASSYASHRRTMSHLRNRFHVISAQLRNWRTNAHYDAINFLLARYDFILIPEFQTKRMAARAERNISSETVRRMFTMSHYMFRSRLAMKAELDENKVVRVIGEPGTSKTCGNCGFWNSLLGGSKTYECPQCGIVLDRDVNGARNNMIALID